MAKKKTTISGEKYLGWKPWVPGDPVLINRIQWGQPEAKQVEDVYKNDWFGPGQKVHEFAKRLTRLTGHKYALPVNSGSSALLLAVRALIDLGRWIPGDLVIHPALTFPTSISGALQCNMEPAFLDIDPATYQINTGQIARLFDETRRTFDVAGAIIPHILGNPSNMGLIRDLLGSKAIIEDCCDTLGGYLGRRYKGQHVGKAGDVAALSFYGSHHVTTAGVGGALLTDDSDIYAQALSMAYWGRNDYSLIENEYERFERRYWYTTSGYDMQMTEMQAGFGIAQLDRLTEANKVREYRFDQLSDYFVQYEDWFVLPEQADPTATPSWFAFPITIKPDAPFSRRQFAEYLIRHKIEIRPIFTGDITQHPAFRRYHGWFGIATNARLAGANGLFLPAWGMSDPEMEYMLGVLEGFLGTEMGR